MLLSFIFLGHSHQIVGCASGVPHSFVFMLFESVPEIHNQLYTTDHYRNQYNMKHLHFEDCQSFANVLKVTAYSLKAYQKIIDLKLTTSIGSMISDWSVIHRNLSQLIARRSEPVGTCNRCRQIINGRLQMFEQIMESVKNRQNVTISNLFLIDSANERMKKIFSELCLQIASVCSGWNRRRQEYVKTHQTNAAEVSYVESRIGQNVKHQVKVQISEVLMQGDNEIQQSQDAGQLKQEVKQEAQPQKFQSRQYQQLARGAPTQSNQDEESRPEKRFAQKKRKL